MTQLPTEGELKLSETLTHFGAPSFSECYRGGTYVPDLTAGAAEQQRITPTGTRSNVSTGGSTGNPEMITIGFDPEFYGGSTDSPASDTLANIATGFGFPLAGNTSSLILAGPYTSAYITFTTDFFNTEFASYTSTDFQEITDFGVSGISTYSSFDETSSLPSSGNISNWSQPLVNSVTSVEEFHQAIVSYGTYTFSNTVSITFSNPTATTVDITFKPTGSTTHLGFLYSRVITPSNVWIVPCRFSIDTSGTNGVVELSRPTVSDSTTISYDRGRRLTHYNFDIDTSGEHFPGTGGTIDIDCTNASTAGIGTVSGALRGSWRTDSLESFAFSSTATATDIALELFDESNSSLRSDITVTRGTGVGADFVANTNGLVVRILAADDGFTFWMVNTTGEGFSWDSDWGVIPTIYADGVEYPTMDIAGSSGGTPQAVAGSLHTVTGNFPANTTSGQLAAQHLHDQIESTYTGVTVSNPTEITGVGGIVDIDCTNATDDGSGSIIQYIHGSWNTRTQQNIVFLENLPLSGETWADVFSDALDSFLRADITMQRGNGVGDSFVVSSSGNTVRLSSATDGFSFWISTSSSSSQNVFLWDTDWDVLPAIYVNGVEYPTTDTVSASTGTPGLNIGTLNQWQIVVNTGISDDVDDASLVITENSGENTQPLTFTVSDGEVGSGGGSVHSTYILNDYSGAEVTMFTSSVASSTDSDLQFVFNTAETAVDDNTETPIDFTATNDTTHLTLDAATAGYVDGLFSLTAIHGSGDGNLSFATTEQTRGVPVGTNGNIPTSGELKLSNFYGGDNGAA